MAKSKKFTNIFWCSLALVTINLNYLISLLCFPVFILPFFSLVIYTQSSKGIKMSYLKHYIAKQLLLYLYRLCILLLWKCLWVFIMLPFKYFMRLYHPIWRYLNKNKPAHNNKHNFLLISHKWQWVPVYVAESFILMP